MSTDYTYDQLQEWDKILLKPSDPISQLTSDFLSLNTWLDNIVTCVSIHKAISK